MTTKVPGPKIPEVLGYPGTSQAVHRSPWDLDVTWDVLSCPQTFGHGTMLVLSGRTCRDIPGCPKTIRRTSWDFPSLG